MIVELIGARVPAAEADAVVGTDGRPAAAVAAGAADADNPTANTSTSTDRNLEVPNKSCSFPIAEQKSPAACRAGLCCELNQRAP